MWMGGFLGSGVLVVNVLEVPRLGAGTVSAVLVSSFVFWVCRSQKQNVYLSPAS
jgi:uncharacterized membrane protein YdcZ (DUF606 family)